jgi:hypothetical protein
MKETKLMGPFVVIGSTSTLTSASIGKPLQLHKKKKERKESKVAILAVLAGREGGEMLSLFLHLLVMRK